MSEPVAPACPAPETFAEPVVIYTTKWCGYCMMALRLLRARNIAFAQVPVDGDKQARAWLEQRTGRHTVPQIFIGGRSVGGYDEISQLDDEGELMPLVAAARDPAR
jgi:glutaredoxin 3